MNERISSYRKFFALFFFLSFNSVCLFSFSEKDSRHDEIISIPSEDTIITVKISFPEKWIKQDKIIIWSNHPTSVEFLPDSITTPRAVWLSPILRNRLLDEGYINIEFLGREDSVEYMGRKYLSTDAHTRAVDMENLLKYIRSVPSMKDKKKILVGDELVDCYPNIERMEQLLKQGGNEHFQKIILEGYYHQLGKWDGGGYIVEDSVLQQIIDWIDKL